MIDEEIKKITKVWLETKFSGEERHLRRINKLETRGGVVKV